MKFLFVMRHAMYMRNFESVVTALCRQGHQVKVGYMTTLEGVHDAQSRRMVREVEGFSYVYVPSRKGPSVFFAKAVRSLLDYLRYQHPRYRHAGKLAGRAALRIPFPVRALLSLPGLDSEGFRRRLDPLLRLCEKLIPGDPEVTKAIESHKPDMVLVSPLVDLGSGELDYLKSSRILGLPVGLCVASWDNLTTKGLIQMLPDFVCVWNEAMKREAIELHAVPAERIFVTGAPLYDHWFTQKPKLSRAEFCGRADFDPAKPFLVYLCSSGFIAAEETAFVKRWILALRASAEADLRGAGILIRPHPANAKQWHEADFSEFKGVIIWPRAGSHPIDNDSKADYFDSIYHSAAVMGINTSGFIEAGIMGRPCLTVLDPVFHMTQTGTLHFSHIAEGGLLYVAKDFAGHMPQIEGLIRGNDPGLEKRTRFLESFIRPQGLGHPSTDIYVDVIETQAAELVPRSRKD
jgi:hypothetical protein